jgi:mannose-6-phosphate isomerase-like protein (cupin superfamily)
MDPRFDEIQQRPENEIFRVVFYPDRIYHAQYLNATRSSRYRYVVHEVRAKQDITVLKGHVFLDGRLLTPFVRLEHRSGRLVEASRQATPPRLAEDEMIAWLRLSLGSGQSAEGRVKLHLCRWTDSHQVEIWRTLEPPDGVHHDASVLDMMGKDGAITRVRDFSPLLADLASIRRVEVAFRENDRRIVTGERISEEEARWDNNHLSSHQEPRSPAPSAVENTVLDRNYLLDFQRGWLVRATEVAPVRYRDAMMDPENPARGADNVVDMRWLLQRELGGPVVFFHEVTVSPGVVEGTHQHIGSEEVYYVVSGAGTAYMGEHDDPRLTGFPVVEQHVYGLGVRRCRSVPVGPGDVIFTKSGGVHGIRCEGEKPLVFVAFLYHSA